MKQIKSARWRYERQRVQTLDNDRRDYTMKGRKESITEKLGGKANCIAMAIFAVIILGGGIAWMEIDYQRQREAQYIGSIPMANQHIEWTYARWGGGK